MQHRSRFDNVYHCCVHKTASQWLKALLSSDVVHRYSGLTVHTYQSLLPGNHDERRIVERNFSEPFPTKTVVTPLYIGFDNYARLPKPADHAVFFVARDPRDIVVSWYFSTRFSHPENPRVARLRQALSGMPPSAGLHYAIDHLADFGLFEAMRSWVRRGSEANVAILRFEDLTGPRGLEWFERLFRHCDIQIPVGTLCTLLNRYSFRRLSGGRSPGVEDRHEHYRKGIAGDWRNQFDPATHAHFDAVTGKLAADLGYEPS